MVLPYREVADLDELDAVEAAELWATVTRAVGVLRLAYRPEGLNVGINLGRPAGGSVREHLHVHVVPRWTGDANFMTAVANTRTLPEALDDTAARSAPPGRRLLPFSVDGRRRDPRRAPRGARRHGVRGPLPIPRQQPPPACRASCTSWWGRCWWWSGS